MPPVKFTPPVRKRAPITASGPGETGPERRRDAKIRLSVGVRDDDYRSGPFELIVRAPWPAAPGRFRDVKDLWLDAAFGARGRIDATMGVGIAAAAWNPLRRLLEMDVPSGSTLSDAEVRDLLDGAADRLEASGVGIEWAPELHRGLGAHVVVGSSEQFGRSVPDVFDRDAKHGLSWQLTLDGDPLDDAEMTLVAGTERPVLRLRDHWVLVSPQISLRAREPDLKPLNAIDALSIALTGSMVVEGEAVPVEATGWIERLREEVTGRDPAPPDPPPGLEATLREYQVEGMRWLNRMTSLGLGGCLADDMGLGKTVMLISLHLLRRLNPRTAGPTLVVCPASLLGNWEREIRRFAPGEPVRRYHGTNRTLDLVASGFVLTTYGTMRLDHEALGRVAWGLVVADEAQHVKNPASAGAKALRTLPGRSRVALTGTPVENNLSELWAILDWTTPGLLGSHAAFRRRWADPIELEHREDVTRELNRLVRPFLLRRRKTDPGIAPELPPKTVTDQPVELTPEQTALYDRTVRSSMAEIRSADGIGRRGLVLKMLTSLKQICNHPAQFTREAKPVLPGRSGKLELLDELLDTIRAEDGAVLVFTQYVAMARLLDRHLKEREIPCMLLHGGTPVRQRERMVERFQNGEARVFLLSLRAAGTGLNLTRADHVIHFDRWWNPAVEEQATDRAHRIGQERPVQVHRLIAEGTVEDRIADIHESKRELAAAIVSSGESALTELSNEDLADLVELRNVG